MRSATTAGAASFAAALVIAVSLVPATAPVAAQTAAQNHPVAPATVALVETWPDGRTTYELTSPRSSWMWTVAFPRVAGFRLPEGDKPVYAVKFERVLAGRDINVQVSVLLKAASLEAVPVASVVVTPGSQVVVDGLIRFGVQPVTLSMVDVVPMTPHRPTVVSVSALIDIAAVEVLNAPYPGYRLTLRNLGSNAVASVQFQSYRLQEKAIGALKRTDDGRPLMRPGATFTFDLAVTSDAGNDSAASGAWSPRPLDLIEFDSVRWEDGTYEGVPRFPQVDPAIDRESGTRLQLRRVIETLRAVLAESRSRSGLAMTAWQRIDALPDAEPDQLAAAKLAMLNTKRTVRADLTWLAEHGSTRSDDVRTQLASLLGRYEAWLTRLSPP
jgi:hypothetical protein